MRSRHLFFFLRLSVVHGMLTSLPTTAQIHADPNAPADQRATILQAGNGVPLVNIQTPSEAGVSRNSYRQFDVDSNGAILNNSRTDTHTQLGGWVSGNPWLAGGSARIILNEVNSTHPSHLNGWIEVAGSRAQVITANPAGITCDGCGFINAAQATLATGIPIMSRGSLDAYRISGGQVRIEGLGLDGRQADALTILTRSAEINAGLWARRLKIVTGTHEVIVGDKGETTAMTPLIISPFPQNFFNVLPSGATNANANANTAPIFALDVSHLGGMYAGHIFLVGSEHGLGVRHAGVMQAAEALTLDSRGELHNGGKITAPELTVKTEGTIDNQGSVIAQGRATIETTSTLVNTGTLVSGQILTIRAQTLMNRGISYAGSNAKASTRPSDGLIDGQRVLINTKRLENRGAGRLYGDDLAVQADILINAGEIGHGGTADTIAQAPVIAARQQLVLGVGEMDNRDGALVLSGGDLSIGRQIVLANDAGSGQPRITTSGFAGRLHNDSATIEVLSNLFIDAMALANRNTQLQIDQIPEAAFSVERLQVAGTNAFYLSSQCQKFPFLSFRLLCSSESGGHIVRNYTLYQLTGTPSRSEVRRSLPGVIRVGGDFYLNGDRSAAARFTNQDSQVLVGGDISLAGTALDNHDTKGSYRVQYSGTGEHTTVETCGWIFTEPCRKWHGRFDYSPAPDITTIDLPTGLRYEGNTRQSSNSGTNSGSNSGSNTNLIPTAQIPPLPGSGSHALFGWRAAPESTGGYLIETDPRFTQYRQWLSSDYLLNALAVDPAMTQKRLGDGFYEQRLVREQVAQLTGRRFLPGYADDEAQYQALMANAATHAQAYALRPGIALTAEQVAQLTSDIVWLVAQTVTLPDGRQTEVLVPKVYARLKAGDLDTDGTLISGRAITAQLKGDLINNALMAADQTLVVTAENIHNLKGSIDGRDVRLYANVDINNLGGRIAATDRLKLQAGRDVNVQSTTQTTETVLSTNEAARGSRFTRTQIDRVAGVYVTASDKAEDTTAADNTLNLIAGRNVTLAAAQLQNQSVGTTTITAGEHLQIVTVTTGQDNKAVKDANNHSHIARREEVGTQISTTGALELRAAQDLTLRAATVTSDGAIDAQAGNDLRIEAGQAESLNDQARKTTHRKTFSRSTTTTRDRFEDSTQIASVLSGQSVNARAAGDITVQASNVVADQDLQLNAGRDLTIIAGADTYAEDHYRHQRKSGVLSAGGAGFTIGKRTQSTDQQTTRTTSSASTVGSLEGNIDLRAGRTYTQTGSDVIALSGQHKEGSGDITITAPQVTITEARETSRTDTQTQFKQSGITVAVSAPIITAAQTVAQMGQAAGNTRDPRMEALAAANAVMAIDQAAEAIQKNPDQLGGVNLSISVGSSKAQSNSTLTTDTSASSNITAANDLSITAISDDLTVQGSQLKAGNAITLQAEKQLKLQAAQDSAEQRSTNSNQSASVGVGFAIGAKQTGVNLHLAASHGRGHADGSDVSWVNTEVTAGQQIKTASGGDTTIRGGVLTAPQVAVTTGTDGQGDLTITSLQDTSGYQSKQEQHGATLSIPIAGGKPSGSLSTNPSKIDSDYASVSQQSGIRAGDAGFTVNVARDTTITGGAITSTQTAIDQGKNTFRTDGTLTTTDINNKAAYEAKSVGVHLGTGFSPSGQLVPQGTGAGLGSDSDSQRSTTQAAISEIAGNTQARTGDTETGLVNRFDVERIQNEINAQMQITQNFGYQAGKRISDHADAQRAMMRDRLKSADTDIEKKAIEDKIYELNMQERALNVMVGAVTGFGGTMLLKESLSTAADQMRQLMIDDSKKFKGITDGKTVLSNISGPSEGVRGDGVKVGGTRVDLDLLCGSANERCDRHPDQSVKHDPKGHVVFSAGSFEDFMETEEGKKMIGPTGGVQGMKGQLFGKAYAAGSWQDQLIEAFSGTHDMIGGKLSGLYDEQGNAKRGMSKMGSRAYDAWAGVALVPAAPFALSEVLSPEIWKAISIFLDAAK